MTNYTAYWVGTILRGAIALIASIAIMIVSDAAATILLLPLAIVFAILILASYIVLDSVLVLATSFMLPHHRVGRLALRMQGTCGVLIGVFFFVFVSQEVQPSWFLYLAAAQAFSVAVAEFLVARGTAEYHNSKWCYASACIAAVSCIVLLINHAASGRQLGWLLYSYLGLFGLNLFVLSAHMLFEEAHATRLAKA